MRSGDCRSAKQVHMTWAEDATMNKGKQCLQRNETSLKSMSRGRGAGKTCLMFCCVHTSYDELTLQRSRPERMSALRLHVVCR